MTPGERLERSSWDLFWVPEHVAVIDRPELLALGAPEPLPHLNAVYRTRAAADALPALIGEVRALHRHTRSRWAVTDTVDPAPLERALEDAGYRCGARHDARVIETPAFAPRAQSGIEVRRVQDAASLRDCLSVSAIAFGRKELQSPSEAQLAAELHACTAPGARTVRYVAYLDDEPVCSGGLNLYPELALGFLWAGGTIPSARGRGAYSTLLAARVSHAARVGLRWIGLYARSDSSSPIVAAHGFEAVGAMTYWETASPVDSRL